MIRTSSPAKLWAWALGLSTAAASAFAQDAATTVQTPASGAPSAPVTAAPSPQGAQLPEASPVVPKSTAEGAESRPDLIELALQPAPGGLTADEIVAHALKTSPQLKSATIQADKAAQNRARAKLAFSPRFDVQASYTRKATPIVQFGDLELTQPNSQMGVAGSVVLPITDIFLTILPTYKGAKKARDVAEYQKAAAELEVSYQARVAFYEYMRMRARAVVAEDSVRLLEAHVNDLRNLVGAGVATETDLVRAEGELGKARAMVVELAGYIEVTALRLSQLVGSPIDQSRGVGEPLVGVELEPTPPMNEVVQRAFSVRPELLALRTLGEVREHFARARKGAMLPQLRATGSVLYANPNPLVFPQPDEFGTTWDVGVALAWSPNDFAYAYTQASDADLDIQLVRQDLIAMEQGVAIEAASAVADHRTAREQVAASVLAVEGARRRYNDQRALMLAGAVTPNEVLEAETLLRRAELDWIDAFVHARMARAALIKAQGSTGLSGSRSAP